MKWILQWKYSVRQLRTHHNHIHISIRCPEYPFSYICSTHTCMHTHIHTPVQTIIDFTTANRACLVKTTLAENISKLLISVWWPLCGNWPASLWSLFLSYRMWSFPTIPLFSIHNQTDRHQRGWDRGSQVCQPQTKRQAHKGFYTFYIDFKLISFHNTSFYTTLSCLISLMKL